MQYQLTYKGINKCSYNRNLQICFKALKKLSNIIYDALYVALAKKLNAKLLSLDKKQRKVAKGKRYKSFLNGLLYNILHAFFFQS